MVLRDVVGYAPIAATVFGVPQFVPQLAKVIRRGDTAGVSWSWAALTSVSNTAWFAYFLMSRFWMALAPAVASALLAALVGFVVSRRGPPSGRSLVATGCWVGLLVGGFLVGGRVDLGSLLTASFVLQVLPSLWTAFATARPTGISIGTWSLIFAELLCWGAYGLDKSDPRLVALGATGSLASAAMLLRALTVWTVGGR